MAKQVKVVPNFAYEDIIAGNFAPLTPVKRGNNETSETRTMEVTKEPSMDSADEKTSDNKSLMANCSTVIKPERRPRNNGNRLNKITLLSDITGDNQWREFIQTVSSNDQNSDKMTLWTNLQLDASALCGLDVFRSFGLPRTKALSTIISLFFKRHNTELQQMFQKFLAQRE